MICSFYSPAVNTRVWAISSQAWFGKGGGGWWGGGGGEGGTGCRLCSARATRRKKKQRDRRKDVLSLTDSLEELS